MAKRKSTRATPVMPMEPSPDEQLRWAAENVAETAVRTDPAVKRRKAKIAASVLKAAKAARG